MTIVFLVEEPSMEAFLKTLLPRLFPDLSFRCIPHEGKQDLLQSIPVKLKGWREPDVRFVILIDKDGQDCIALKRKINELCGQSGHENTIIRIVCQELEAWYLGDFQALASAYEAPKLIRYSQKAKYRNPDAVLKPSKELQKILPRFQKISGARALGNHINANNKSHSFQVFIKSMEKFCQEN